MHIQLYTDTTRALGAALDQLGASGVAASFLDNPLFHLETFSGKNKGLKRAKSSERINWCERNKEIYIESHTFIDSAEQPTVDGVFRFLPCLDVLQ